MWELEWDIRKWRKKTMEVKDNTQLFGKNKEEEKKEEVVPPVEEKKIEELLLQDVISKIDWDKYKENPHKILPSAQVIIIAFDPVTRGTLIHHVKNSYNITTGLNICREVVNQLQLEELLNVTLSNMQHIVNTECAKLYAKLTGSIRR